MWLSKPFYEALPFAYIAVGLACLIASVWLETGRWPLVSAMLGLAALIGGLVIWLKRRGYRSSRSRAAFDEEF